MTHSTYPAVLLLALAGCAVTQLPLRDDTPRIVTAREAYRVWAWGHWRAMQGSRARADEIAQAAEGGCRDKLQGLRGALIEANVGHPQAQAFVDSYMEETRAIVRQQMTAETIKGR